MNGNVVKTGFGGLVVDLLMAFPTRANTDKDKHLKADVSSFVMLTRISCVKVN